MSRACSPSRPSPTSASCSPRTDSSSGLRELTRATDTLLIIDETHTASAGPGGCTGEWGLQPDLVTLGKWLGGGVPIGAYGVSAEVAERIESDPDADYVDTGGVGGTLAGNALSLAAARGTMSEVLTDEAHEGMTALCGRFVAGCEREIAAYSLPWSVVQLGARAEYVFTAPEPRDGAASAAASDPELEDFLHLRLLNEGVLLTPFHNMALMCPATTEADVDRHTKAFGRALDDLVNEGGGPPRAPTSNADVIRDQYAAVNERDWDRAMSHFAEDVELVIAPGGIRSGTFSGRDKVGRWFGEWFGSFDRTLHFEIIGFEERPDGSLDVTAEHVARGKSSGAELTTTVIWRHWFRDGRIARLEGLDQPGM